MFIYTESDQFTTSCECRATYDQGELSIPSDDTVQSERDVRLASHDTTSGYHANGKLVRECDFLMAYAHNPSEHAACTASRLFIASSAKS
jgi:hypothetical protein